MKHEDKVLDERVGGCDEEKNSRMSRSWVGKKRGCRSGWVGGRRGWRYEKGEEK